MNPNLAQYRKQSGAYRAYMRKVAQVGHHPAGYAGPAVAAPAGFSAPFADPLLSLPRAEHLRLQRADREELTRREFEREEYTALGLDAPRYIRSDDVIRGGMEARRYFYLKNTVRRAHLPLSTLVMHELDLRLMFVWSRAA